MAHFFPDSSTYIQFVTFLFTKNNFVQISDDGIFSLVKGSSGKNIKELRIDNCPNVTELGLKLIAENCPNIETLMFYNCSTDRGNFVVKTS